jgi:hypothetical protein
MADQDRRDSSRDKGARELDERQLDEVAGGFEMSRTAPPPEPPIDDQGRRIWSLDDKKTA